MLQNNLESNPSELIPPCNDQCSFCFLNYADILSENSLFRNLLPKEIGRIIREVHHQVKSCEKNEIIAYEGDEYDKLMIIVKGSVVGEMMDFEGKVLRIEQLQAPDTVASVFIFGISTILPVNIRAIEATRLLLIHRNDLIELLSKNKILLKNYLDIMSNRAQHLSKRLKMLAMQNIRSKLAHYLLEEIKNAKSDQFRLRHTQNELAEIFGVIRPSVARILKELNEEKIILTKGKSIQITDRKKLSDLLK